MRISKRDREEIDLQSGQAQKQSSEKSDPLSESIIRTARKFLGYGYDRINGKGVLDQVLKDYSDSAVVVYSQETHQVTAIHIDSEEAKKELQKRTHIDFTPSFLPNASRSKGSKETHAKNFSTFFCAASVFHTAKCRFRNTPPLKPDAILPNPQRGDSFVRSGTVATGYNIVLEVGATHSTNKTTEKTNSDFGVELIGFGVSWENLQQNLHEKTIQYIAIKELRGSGNCFLDFPINKKYTSIEDLHGILERIKNDFIMKLPTIEGRVPYIDPINDLNSFDFAPVEDFSSAKSARPSTKAKQPIQPVNFSDLALQIKPARQLIFADFFKQIATIFPVAFKCIKDAWEGGNYTTVIGKSGIGKSTLIAYLLGNELRFKKIDGEQGTYSLGFDYLQDSKKPRPKIGHDLKSETIVQAYGEEQGYIDTAGLFDTRGKPTILNATTADVCNAFAINMVVDALSPNRLIVVLSSNAFDGRAQEFIEMIETLRRVVIDPTHSSKWPYIRFVINDHLRELAQKIDADSTKAGILNQIRRLKIVLEKGTGSIAPGSKCKYKRTRLR